MVYTDKERKEFVELKRQAKCLSQEKLVGKTRIDELVKKYNGDWSLVVAEVKKTLQCKETKRCCNSVHINKEKEEEKEEEEGINVPTSEISQSNSFPPSSNEETKTNNHHLQNNSEKESIILNEEIHRKLFHFSSHLFLPIHCSSFAFYSMLHCSSIHISNQTLLHLETKYNTEKKI